MGCWNSPNTKDAYRLSLASLGATIAAGIAGIVLYRETGNSLCLTFALESFVDFSSSVAVLWRFFAPFAVDAAVEEKLDGREQRASMSISFVLIILGIAVMGTAIGDYTRGQEDPDSLRTLIGLSFLSTVIFGSLAMLKFRYATALDSPSLYKDGLCSMIGTILSVTLFINSLIVEEFPGFWFIDPTVAFFCGMVALFLGCHHVGQARKAGIPIFSSSWWSTGDGGPSTNGGGMELAGAQVARDSEGNDGDLV